MEDSALNRAFSQLNRLSYRRNPYLECQYNGVFNDDYLLQFTWQGGRVVWQRTTYIKYQHSPLWAYWQGERPTLRYNLGNEDVWEMLFYREVGELTTPDLQPIIQALQAVKIENCYNNCGDGRDGAQWSLRMGDSSTFASLALSWWTCAPPDSWLPFQKIVEQLLQFATPLQADETAFFIVKQELETNENGHSLFIDCQKYLIV